MTRPAGYGAGDVHEAGRAVHRRRHWIVAGVLVAGLTAAALYSFNRPAFQPLGLETGIALPQPRQLPDFALVDQHARPLDRASLEGRWTLLFAGFTHCPDVCPATLATLAQVDERLADAHRDIQVLFLSLDPARDDPETLASYVEHFDPRFRGATGAGAEIDRLMAAAGLAYVRVPTGAETYTIDHSTALALIDPHARVVAYFKAPLRPDDIAADLVPVLAAR